MNTEFKTDEIIVKQIRNRYKAKKRLLSKLRFEKEQILAEIERIWYSDTVKDLAQEFGVSKTTVARICKGAE